MDFGAKILVVEDDLSIRTLLGLALQSAGYTNVTMAGRGDDGLAAAIRDVPDLILLDLMLPGLDGMEVARRVRSTPALAATRIIMLTARTESEDICRGLEAGADDYVTKPYDREVLIARIRAVLRRGLPATEGIDFDGLTIDEPNRLARLHGRMLELTVGEFELLVRLVAHRGRILTRTAAERTVDVQIAKLRQKLGAWSSHIETIRGIGYRVS